MIFAPYPGSQDFKELLAAGKVEMKGRLYYLALAASGLSSKTYNPRMCDEQLVFAQVRDAARVLRDGVRDAAVEVVAWLKSLIRGGRRRSSINAADEDAAGVCEREKGKRIAEPRGVSGEGDGRPMCECRLPFAGNRSPFFGCVCRNGNRISSPGAVRRLSVAFADHRSIGICWTIRRVTVRLWNRWECMVTSSMSASTSTRALDFLTEVHLLVVAVAAVVAADEVVEDDADFEPGAEPVSESVNPGRAPLQHRDGGWRLGILVPRTRNVRQGDAS